VVDYPFLEATPLTKLGPRLRWFLSAAVDVSPPPNWKESCANTECTLHQISPYIGKLKSVIAGDLIEKYSRRGDLIVDPFTGSGTIPLEGALRKRRVFASDISPYARVLSKAKLLAPPTLDDALRQAEAALDVATCLPRPDLSQVPKWVRSFFHPRTLAEAINFAAVARKLGNEFIFACFLGILHHQRPGFLSYPSSHLVPYLRSRKYPRTRYPGMYSYRELRPRILGKIKRVYKRFSNPHAAPGITFRQSAVEHIALPESFDCLITSPPYMNALDYGRDNRLRLWFIDPSLSRPVDNAVTQRRDAFIKAMRCLATKVHSGLKRKGHCVIIVGESLKRSFQAHPAETVMEIMANCAKSLRLKLVIADDIPDIRRARRECSGVKRELFLIFQKN
jgi:putative RNA methylase family UPF0020